MIPAALGEWLLWLWFALIDLFSSRWRWGPLKFLQNKKNYQLQPSSTETMAQVWRKGSVSIWTYPVSKFSQLVTISTSGNVFSRVYLSVRLFMGFPIWPMWTNSNLFTWEPPSPHGDPLDMFKLVHLGKRAVGLRLKGLLVWIWIQLSAPSVCKGGISIKCLYNIAHYFSLTALSFLPPSTHTDYLMSTIHSGADPGYPVR